MKGTKARRHGGTKGNVTKLRRIAVITGTRAEYGLLRSTMMALKTHLNIELQLVVTGSHLVPRFGHTVDEIIADGWQINACVPMQHGDDGPLDQTEGLARGTAGIANFLHGSKTDIVVVLGDRIEALAGALAAITTGRVLAHIHGGDLAAGDFDDAIRHSITKLAHLHFPATAESSRRIVRMGEPEGRVFLVGAPGLDDIHRLIPSRARDSNSHEGRKQALVLQHPCGRNRQTEYKVMDTILAAAQAEHLDVTCLYPNTDRGHQGILDAIDAYSLGAKNGEFRVVPTMPRDEFLLAMHDTDVLVGNSSSGIIEAASIGTPAVNVGLRQAGRQVSGNAVIHCAESLSSIRAAIQRALRKRKTSHKSTPYGDGRAGERIAKTLARIPLDDSLRRKLNAY